MKKTIKKCMVNVSIDAESSTAEFLFSEDFLGFNGHFPNNPIVPGVCLIQCALVLAETICRRAVQVRVIKTAKFMSAVVPCQLVQMKCSIVDDLVTASFMSGDTRIATLKMIVIDA